MSRRRAYPAPQYASNAAPGQAPFNPVGAVDQLGQNFQNLNFQNGAVDPNAAQYSQQNGYDYSQQAYGGVPMANNNPQTGYPDTAAQAQPYNNYGGYDQSYGGTAPAPQQQVPADNNAYGYAASAASTSQYGAVPQYGSAGSEVLPFNKIYTYDLLKEFPPQISDLGLPPPPIILPSNSTLIPGNDKANAPHEYLRSTLNVVPTTHSLLKKSKLPFALCISPYTALREDQENVPVSKDTIICRCRRCRGYINPFVTLTENDKRWRCNFCGLQNDIPLAYDYDSTLQQPVNRYDRAELTLSVVEFIAPKEYMARAPAPLVYFFFIDVSMESINSGAASIVAREILMNLDNIPDKHGTTRICVVGVDSGLHLFKFKEGLDEAPELLVVTDLESAYAPSPTGLSIKLSENRKAIELMLANFSAYFEGTANTNFALGPALRFGYIMLESSGGKMMVFSSSMPNIGEGKLTIRDDPAASGKAKEVQALMRAADKFYKSFAVQCSSAQISIDLFLTGAKYLDVASLSNLLRYTAGQTHYYPAWNSEKAEDVTKLSMEISKHLSMECALEAVLRIRCSTGFRTSQFYGNFFNRSSDLCSFPFFPRDQGYVIEVSIEENIPKPVVYFQAAVLHTTCYGERRIRVINLALPTSSKLEDIYASADQLAITNYLTHIAIAKALDSSLPNARDFLVKSAADLLSVYRKELIPGNIAASSPLQITSSLKMLPLLLYSLTKHAAFRDENVPVDQRAIAINNLGSWPLSQLIKYIYPTVYILHDMPAEAGLPEELVEVDPETGEERIVYGDIVLPPPANCSKATWDHFGLYLIDTGTEMFMWVSGMVVETLLQDLFGVNTIDEVESGKQELCELLPEEQFEFNYRVRNIINKVRTQKNSIIWKSLYIVVGTSSKEPMEVTLRRDLMALRAWPSSFMIEDKTIANAPDYREFLKMLAARAPN